LQTLEGISTALDKSSSVSSGVAGLWFWVIPIGNVIWQSLVTLAAILAVIKPFANYTQQIQQKSEILSKWKLYDEEINYLRISIKQFGQYDEENRNTFLALLKTRSSIEKGKTDAPDNKLQLKCEEKVKTELPADKFFIPED
jgi:hypothetical protein